ncbi:hypothetical protein IAQ61_001322 [Plenodomus lingam]|uniref:uncharacterized protein n=1 Tax=Leptosphaeria maculans TaxID=5022 RepID=UPI00332245F3|nr:hypothetical protein IAQ61_001322 [Plenodomus lingam]
MCCQNGHTSAVASYPYAHSIWRASTTAFQVPVPFGMVLLEPVATPHSVALETANHGAHVWTCWPPATARQQRGHARASSGFATQ